MHEFVCDLAETELGFEGKKITMNAVLGLKKYSHRQYRAKAGGRGESRLFREQLVAHWWAEAVKGSA